MDKYIGFDIDSKKTVACVVEKGKKDIYRTLRTDIGQMKKFLQMQQRAGEKLHLTFEISGQAGYHYDRLSDSVEDIAVSNPAKMTWIYRTSKKNDRIDAHKQAILLSIGQVPKVHMPGRRIRQWRRTIQHRRHIVGGVGQVKNRIRAVLKSQGFTKPAVRGSWWKLANRAWMRSLTEQMQMTSEQLWRMSLADMLEQLALLESQLKRVTRYLDLYLDKQGGGKLLMSIPGVGPRTAEAVLAYTDDIDRFGRSKQYCSYFGLTPRLDESGSIRRLGHISKQGPSVVRRLLVESSWRVIKKSPSLRAFYERVMCGQKGRRKIAVVAVARKLLSIMRAMQTSGELFNERLVCRAGGFDKLITVERARERY
ncbi:MAG: IS110 family RNA-guided transposase [Planctomycetota bacterium]|jgi:transposase